MMLVMNQHGMDNLLASKFKIGANISGAAGPVGRDAAAATDWKMRAEVLTYSRARGVFAGVTLNGAVIKQDTNDTLALYGKFVPFRTILTGSVPPPARHSGLCRKWPKSSAQPKRNKTPRTTPRIPPPAILLQTTLPGAKQ